jgi:hypothetical protein
MHNVKLIVCKEDVDRNGKKKDKGKKRRLLTNAKKRRHAQYHTYYCRVA